MKFTEFRKLVEKYRNLLSEGKIEEANIILSKIDPNNNGLKKFFMVKKYRVEKIIERYFESIGVSVRYDMDINSNRSYDLLVKLSNDENYLIKCYMKKGIGYAHLKCLYKNTELCKDDLGLMTKKYPEIEEELWQAVKDTNNEKKRRDLFSLNSQIIKKRKELNEKGEDNLIVKTIERLQKQVDEVLVSLEDVDVENNVKL